MNRSAHAAAGATARGAMKAGENGGGVSKAKNIYREMK
jgi:hypothetical protein